MVTLRSSVLAVVFSVILSGYFEPANAQSCGTEAHVTINAGSSDCTISPNPVSPYQSIVVTADISDPVSTAYVTYMGGGPAGTVEGNTYYPGTIESNVVSETKFLLSIPLDVVVSQTNCTFSGLSAGYYLFTAKTASGQSYNVKFTVSQ